MFFQQINFFLKSLFYIYIQKKRYLYSRFIKRTYNIDVYYLIKIRLISLQMIAKKL